MCDCTKAVNERLHFSGGEIMQDMMGAPYVFISTVKLPGKRGKLPLVAATYCPFCGKKYPPHKSLFSKV